MTFFLDHEEEGFDYFNGETDATGEESWSNCLVRDPATPDVATDGDAIFFNGEERGDLGRGEFGWLDNVSEEVV